MLIVLLRAPPSQISIIVYIYFRDDTRHAAGHAHKAKNERCLYLFLTRDVLFATAFEGYRSLQHHTMDAR